MLMREGTLFYPLSVWHAPLYGTSNGVILGCNLRLNRLLYIALVWSGSLGRIACSMYGGKWCQNVTSNWCCFIDIYICALKWVCLVILYPKKTEIEGDFYNLFWCIHILSSGVFFSLFFFFALHFMSSTEKVMWACMCGGIRDGKRDDQKSSIHTLSFLFLWFDISFSWNCISVRWFTFSHH